MAAKRPDFSATMVLRGRLSNPSEALRKVFDHRR
jgi:hypothetical protein